MQERLRQVGTPGPKVVVIDEISIRNGHTYHIVVRDLERRRPIWLRARIAQKRLWTSSISSQASQKAGTSGWS